MLQGLAFQTAPAEANEKTMHELLFLADVLLMVVGAGICAVAGVLWLRKGRRDPLRAAPARPNSLTPADVLACLAVWALGFVLARWALAGRLELALPAEQAQQVIGSLANNIAELAGAAACLLVGAVSFRGGWRGFGLMRRPVGRDLTAAAVGYLAVLPICTGLVYVSRGLIHVFRPGYELPRHPVLESLDWLVGWPRWALIGGAILVAPLAEELFFRGLVQSGLGRLLRGRWPAVVCTGLLFGAIHTQPEAVVPLAVLGIALGYLYERTGSLIAPILMHALFNAKNIIWTLLAA